MKREKLPRHSFLHNTYCSRRYDIWGVHVCQCNVIKKDWLKHSWSVIMNNCKKHNVHSLTASCYWWVWRISQKRGSELVSSDLTSTLFLLFVESVQTAAENPAAGPSGAEPEAEDCPRAVRAVCEGEGCFQTSCCSPDNCRKKWRSSENHTTETSHMFMLFFN